MPLFHSNPTVKLLSDLISQSAAKSDIKKMELPESKILWKFHFLLLEFLRAFSPGRHIFTLFRHSTYSKPMVEMGKPLVG